jgi:hypothetical protein
VWVCRVRMAGLRRERDRERERGGAVSGVLLILVLRYIVAIEESTRTR